MPKYDLSFTSPVMNAAGTLGFTPDRRLPVDWLQIGAFITNPVSLTPRAPAQERCCLPFQGGFLLHTGYPNPGFRAIVRRFAERWKNSPLPVIVHLLAQRGDEIATMVQTLETMEGISGVELGLPPEVNQEAVLEFSGAISGELPWIARLPLEQALELGPLLVNAGAAAISLGPPRGTLPLSSGKLAEGRLYGPAIFPFALHIVRRLRRLSLPVIGAGGIYSQEQTKAMLEAGAIAVQLDAVLWRGGYF